MKVVILAGGFGTRLAEVTDVIPKPMVEIGGRPMLWHIIRSYAAHGFNEFIIALGYKGEVIKQYFLDYYHRSTDISVHLGEGTVDSHQESREDWIVRLIDTGQQTGTGGRVKRVSPWTGDEPFMMTYGDGLSDVDIGKLVEFHRGHGKLATVTAVRPAARFGELKFDGDMVTSFVEKPQVAEGWINGGFFVLEPGAFEYIDGDETMFEQEPLARLAQDRQLVAYRHQGFWQSADTLRDIRLLRRMWEDGNAPWKPD